MKFHLRWNLLLVNRRLSRPPAHVVQIEDTVDGQEHVHAGDGEVVDEAVGQVVELLGVEEAHEDEGSGRELEAEGGGGPGAGGGPGGQEDSKEDGYHAHAVHQA